MALIPSVQTNKNLEILKGQKRVECIGLLRERNDDGDIEYNNVVVTIEDGKITDVKKLVAAYTENDAINFATAWVDENYLD